MVGKKRGGTVWLGVRCSEASQSRFDSSFTLLSSKPAQGSTVSLANSVPRAGIGVANSILAALASPTPDFKLNKSAARIGDAGTTGRLTSSEILVLASSNTMPLEPFFSYALSLLLCLSDVSFPPPSFISWLVSANVSGLADIPSEH